MIENRKTDAEVKLVFNVNKEFPEMNRTVIAHTPLGSQLLFKKMLGIYKARILSVSL